MADTLKNWSGVRGLGGKALENFTGMVCVVGKISRCNSDSPLSFCFESHSHVYAGCYIPSQTLCGALGLLSSLPQDFTLGCFATTCLKCPKPNLLVPAPPLWLQPLFLPLHSHSTLHTAYCQSPSPSNDNFLKCLEHSHFSLVPLLLP